MIPVFFRNQTALRAWFEQHYRTEKELWVGYYKVETRKESVNWSQSVDEAICFGWIDGIRRSIDHESYCIRFTPRKPRSNWSRLNISKAEELIRLNRMYPEGLNAYSKKKVDEVKAYSYENMQEESLPEEMEKHFRQQEQAWNYFISETPSYRKTTIRWILGARQEATRLNRLQELILSCESGERIKAMRWSKKK
jgi:uncharacterized protein YdeI (YjbR/CyaY-like superfamily)